MKRDKIFLLSIVGVLGLGFFFLVSWYKSREAIKTDNLTKGNPEILVRSYSPVLGPSDAKVTVVEFLDPECESCAAFFPSVKSVISEFGEKVRLVIRYMPLHPNSPHAVGILEGARRQGKFWEALALIFSRQPEWASHTHPRPELLIGYMKELGLDIEQLQATMQDSEYQNRIQQDKFDGQQLGITRTPSFFVNGRPLERLGQEELRFAIQAELQK